MLIQNFDRPIVFGSFHLQLVFSSSDDRILVSGANTSEIIQGQIDDRYTAESLRFHERSFIAGGVWILVTHPDAFRSSVRVVGLISVTAIFLGRVTDTSKSSSRVLGQFGAHLCIRQQSRLAGVGSWGTRTVGHDGRHAGNLAFVCQFPRASMCGDTDDNSTTGSAVLQPVSVNQKLFFILFFLYIKLHKNMLYARASDFRKQILKRIEIKKK